MNKIIKILYTKLARVYFFIRFIILSVRQMSRRLPEDRPKIIFHLMDDRLYRDGDGSGRYAYLIMNLFSEGGYIVFFFKILNLPVLWDWDATAGSVILSRTLSSSRGSRMIRKIIFMPLIISTPASLIKPGKNGF